jgi:GDP/UDP-N,N'-diacetylbacillosamine 2-epimerase (hydrolysing)
MEVIAFGAHLMKRYGHTINAVYEDGYNVQQVPGTMSEGDSPSDIAYAMSSTIRRFTDFYKEHKYDLLFALGDRYEMFSAVAASVPYNLDVAHIHGGETTLGSIDNSFRHSITHFSRLHFTASEKYKARVVKMLGSRSGVYNVGALSIDAIKNLKLLQIDEFTSKYGLDLGKSTILFTFHPETIAYQQNERHISEIINAIQKLGRYQFLITMPNADTFGMIIRDALVRRLAGRANIKVVENLGSRDYLSAMKYCSFLMGNSSSGFIEASFFSKPVINLGERQEGRIKTQNIITVDIDEASILKTVKKIESQPGIVIKSVYGNGAAASKIVRVLKNMYHLKHN